MRYFIFLAYDGTEYHGWQRQPNALSVQECFERILTQLYGAYIPIVGAGRTDTGVHASMMAAHFDIDREIDTAQLTFKFNCLLPPDISVYGVFPVSSEGHARFSALQRTYYYHLYFSKDPFNRRFACRLYTELDFELMNVAAARLLEHTDFGSFCKSHSDNKTNICHVTRAVWVPEGRARWRFEISADRFLRNMVRAIVGTLIDVGRHRLTVDDFESIIQAGHRSASGDSVPACGLSLVDIVYPCDIFTSNLKPEGLCGLR